LKRGPAVRSYLPDRALSDRFLADIKRHLAPYVRGCPVEVASEFLDQKQATDIVAGDIRIAWTVRSMGRYWPNYRRQFTVRFKRDNGTKTELAKIAEGHCDWKFYGFHDDVDRVLEWYLIDLHAFRLHWQEDRHLLRYEIKQNGVALGNPEGDGTSFIAFWIDSFPWFPGILVAEHLYAERDTHARPSGLPGQGGRGPSGFPEVGQAPARASATSRRG
jgi:hypothetical protein